ncbi:RNA polymerase sigma factor [Pedobacter gandavensis]|uniref:RNA polymerase sigma factor n=1 Tax=Pedobacter gandavensis TaxID=2679963 RepID=UPI00292F7C0F|nr:sigma-70 family RNA polymerase sigma factor [Pedobacter gandavensis]
MLSYISDLKTGNHESFEMVFRLSHKKVYAYFFKKTNDEDIAQDLTQLAFIKLWNFKHTLSEDHELDVQLFRIARTTLLDYFKKLSNDDRNLKLYYNSVSEEATDQHQKFEINQQLEVALSVLPPTRKKVFILNRLQGYSYKEISEQLSISPRTVEKHISLAMKQLDSYAYVPVFILLTKLLP